MPRFITKGVYNKASCRYWQAHFKYFSNHLFSQGLIFFSYNLRSDLGLSCSVSITAVMNHIWQVAIFKGKTVWKQSNINRFILFGRSKAQLLHFMSFIYLQYFWTFKHYGITSITYTRLISHIAREQSMDTKFICSHER